MKEEDSKKGRPRKVLSKQQILSAMSRTFSNLAASRSLHVSYPHYKKYAKLYKDEETGKTLFELHKNRAGKGIPKLNSTGSDFNIDNLRKIIEGKAPVYSWSPKTLKTRIIQAGFIEEKCDRCGFSERRVVDSKVPLILHFKDGDKSNWKKENLAFLCYNCYFLYVEEIFTKRQIDAVEDYTDEKKTDDVTWELSDEMLEHFQDLGLTEDVEEDGEEFLDYL